MPAALKNQWLFAYLAFIIYGSLVPLDFHPHSLAWAWERFQQTPMLNLGIESRADWIANGVLYFPAGFLLTERFTGRFHGGALAGAVLLSIAALAFIAFSVEFAQIFFPPRTVSQNDLLAETLGGTLGVLFALPYSHAVRRMAAFRPAHGEQGVTLLLGGYMAAYLAFCFFPFDFFLSAQEVSAKLASDHWGWLFAASQHENGLRTLLTMMVEVAAIMPFGAFIARRRAAPPSAWLLIASGLLIGLMIEAIQFFTYTAVSQGISIFTRALGVYVGGMLWHRLRTRLGASDRVSHLPLREMIWRHQVLWLLLYLCSVVLLTGWLYRPWGDIETALAALSKLHFMPFYYHYYVSEANALTSLLTVALLYAPLGVFAWASGRWQPLTLYLPAALAGMVETVKLFSSSTHADPTNLLIAVATARVTALVAERIIPDGAGQAASITPPEKKEAHEEKREQKNDSASASSPLQATPANHPALTKRHLALLALVAAGVSYWLGSFPVQPLLLAALFLASALAVWRKPVALLLIIPAALPILDLAPWSGRFYLDEFDMLLAVTLAVGYARTSSGRTHLHPAIKTALVLLALSITISALRALLPWHTPDTNAFSSYFSPFNALRIGKGFVWAILFIQFTQRLDLDSTDIFKWFAWGMTLGLTAVVAVVIREKTLFGGLLDFSSDYRATGPFSAIHTGGAYIEAYLVAAVPFLIYLLLHIRSRLLQFLGPVLLITSTYALMATISRGGFAAYAIACGLAFLTALIGSGKKLARSAFALLLASVSLAIAIPLMSGSFVQQRLSSSTNDFSARQAHWADGLAIRDDSLMTQLFGMGLGRFPITHYLSSRELGSRTSVHALAKEHGNKFLRIAPGNTLYVEQIIPLQPQQHYQLRFDFRPTVPGTSVGIAVCEKWMLASHRCASLQQETALSPSKSGAQNNQPHSDWRPLTYTLDTDTLGSSEDGSKQWLGKRSIKLSFYSNTSAIVDIDNIRMGKATGPNLIANGDFSRGMDRWYFATDHDLAWHLHCTPIAILFDQGWFGVLAWGTFAALALYMTARTALRGNPAAGVAAAAMAGYGVVSLLGAVIDTPRFLFLGVVLATLTTRRTRRMDQRGSEGSGGQ
jgi:VanZ family protein